MNSPKENEEGPTLAEKISGGVQRIIGEIEEVGGALTGDPNTIAEGEFNQEVGDIREELEDEGVEEETDK